MQIGVVNMKTLMAVLQKIKLDILFEPNIPLLGTHPKNPMSHYLDTIIPMFTVALFTIIRIWKEARYSSTDQ